MARGDLPPLKPQTLSPHTNPTQKASIRSLPHPRATNRSNTVLQTHLADPRAVRPDELIRYRALIHANRVPIPLQRELRDVGEVLARRLRDAGLVRRLRGDVRVRRGQGPGRETEPERRGEGEQPRQPAEDDGEEAERTKPALHDQC